MTLEFRKWFKSKQYRCFTPWFQYRVVGLMKVFSV